MNTFSAVADLLALCACATALVDLDGCKRSFVEVGSAMEDEFLRKLVEKQLGKRLMSKSFQFDVSGRAD